MDYCSAGRECTWNGGQTMWDGGQTMWDGGQTMWDGGQTMWDGGQTMWDGGQTMSKYVCLGMYVYGCMCVWEYVWTCNSLGTHVERSARM